MAQHATFRFHALVSYHACMEHHHSHTKLCQLDHLTRFGFDKRYTCDSGDTDSDRQVHRHASNQLSRAIYILSHTRTIQRRIKTIDPCFYCYYSNVCLHVSITPYKHDKHQWRCRLKCRARSLAWNIWNVGNPEGDLGVRSPLIHLHPASRPKQ